MTYDPWRFDNMEYEYISMTVDEFKAAKDWAVFWGWCGGVFTTICLFMAIRFWPF